MLRSKTNPKISIPNKIPVHVDRRRELEWTNLITLCMNPDSFCHFNLGHLGSYESWNVNVERDADDWLARRSRRPTYDAG